MAVVQCRQWVPDVKGKVTFLTPEPGKALAAGMAIGIRITVQGKDGPIVSDYGFSVRREPKTGRVEGFDLTRDQEDGTCKRYHVDGTFGLELGSLACECRDFITRGYGRRIMSCKHCCATSAIIERFGIKSVPS